MLQRDPHGHPQRRDHPVSNPISGEVGAAATLLISLVTLGIPLFQTPSAGRWVLQRDYGVGLLPPSQVSNPISGEVGAAAHIINVLRDMFD